jgi:hypothetical protein
MKLISSQNPTCGVEILKQLYKKKRLTQCLTFLEGRGIEGDVAIFLLSSLNVGGER